MAHPLDDRLSAAIDALRELERQVPPRSGQVHLHHEGGVTWVLLDNPRAHNALTAGMMRQLGEAVREVARSEAAVVALASAHGGSFCAGGHLGQVREALVQPELALLMTDAMQEVLDVLLALPALSVAVLEGPAIGGGVELASACDLRVGTPEVRMHAAQVRLGVACGWGGAGRLVTHLGRGRALRVLARSEPLSAAQSLEIGLLDAMVSGDRHGLLRALLGPALEHPAAAVRAVKRQIAGEDAADAFLEVWGGADHLAALRRS